MRNLYSIAVKCSRIVDRSLIRCNAIFFLRHFASEKKPRKRTRTIKSTFADSTLEATKSVTVEFPIEREVNGLYLKDEVTARRIAAVIAAQRITKIPRVMQMNPGLGLLTEKLLQTGIKEIEMFEAIEYFWPGLINLQQQYPNRLRLQKVDFAHILKVAYSDWKNRTDELDSYFGNVKEERSWRNIATIEIIGTVVDKNVIYRIVRSLIFQKNLRKRGRMVLYLCMPPSISLQLNCKNDHYDLYRTPVILFQTLFRRQVLEELPRSAFYPKYSRSKKNYKICRQKLHEKDNESMHLVKIEANPHLFNDKFTEMDLLTYYHFVNHHFKARVTRVIPALENWIPGCGQALIKEGYNIYTEFGELLPHEILNLYVKFKSLPGFKKSSFLSSTNTFFSEIEEHIGITENIDDVFQTSVKEFEDEKKQLTQ